DAPAAAAVIAVPVASLKVKIFVLSALLGAFSGSLFAHYVSFVSTDCFAVDRAISFLLVAVLGGTRTITAPIPGALFVSVIPNALSGLGDAHSLLFALSLILVVIFMPEGIGGALLKLRRKLWNQRSVVLALYARGEKP